MLAIMLDRSAIRALTSQEWAAQKRTLLRGYTYHDYRDEYHRLAKPWVDGGWNILPGFNKRPPPGVAVGRGPNNLGRPDAPRVSDKLLDDALRAAWTAGGGGPRRLSLPPEPLLWPSSHPDWPLAVYDADNPASVSWGWETFGPPTTQTRKGAHWYFLCDPECPVTSHPFRPIDRPEARGDVKGWCGLVVAPGGLGGVYAEASVDPAACDDFPYELFGQVKTKDARVRRRHALVTGRASYAPAPSILGTMEVCTEGGIVRPLQECEGLRIHAPTRVDRHPSATLSRWDDGRLVVWDPGSQELGIGGTRTFVIERHELRRMEEADERFGSDPDPVPGDTLLAALRRDDYHAAVCPMTHGNRYVNVLPPDGPGVTIIVAGHGKGKTYCAQRFLDAAQCCITVTNTTFLAEANAERFGLTSYQEGYSERVSTTLESLGKFTDLHPDVLHIDEADAVLSFMFSSVCASMVERFMELRKQMRRARQVIITSADLDYYHIRTFLAWVQDDKPHRVFVDVPVPGTRHVKMVSSPQAKQELWDLVSEKTPGVGAPFVVGATERQSVAAMARTFEGYGYTCGWMSADNSRLEDTVHLVQTIDEYLKTVDVLFFSPTLQSGVSINTPVAKVFILHTLQDIDVETVAQMAMRFRNPEDTEIVWAAKDWVPCASEWPTTSGALNLYLTDLEDDMVQVARVGVVKVGAPPPKFQHSPDLVLAWRTVERRARLSFRDPIARIKEVAAGHGWTLSDDRDPEFKWTIPGQDDARTEIKKEWVQRILTARPLTPEEIAFPEHRHENLDDQDAFEAHKLKEFYGSLDEERLGRHSVSHMSAVRRFALTRMDEDEYMRHMRRILGDLDPAETPKKARPLMQTELLRTLLLEVNPFTTRIVPDWADDAKLFRGRYRTPCERYLPAEGKKGDAAWLGSCFRLLGLKQKRSTSAAGIKTLSWDSVDITADSEAALTRYRGNLALSKFGETECPSVFDIGQYPEITI